jgi:hypothetical protein
MHEQKLTVAGYRSRAEEQMLEKQMKWRQEVAKTLSKLNFGSRRRRSIA